MKIKKGDMVKVISGGAGRKDKIGRVLEVNPKTERVKIEGVAVQKRHLKPQRDQKRPEGGIFEQLGTIHVSNVMLMSEELGRPVRTGQAIMDNGDKARVARGKKVKAERV